MIRFACFSIETGISFQMHDTRIIGLGNFNEAKGKKRVICWLVNNKGNTGNNCIERQWYYEA